MSKLAKERYLRNITSLRREEESFRKQGDEAYKRADEKKRIADDYEARLDSIFPLGEDEGEAHAVFMTRDEKKDGPVPTSEQSDRGFYFAELDALMSDHRPRQAAKEIIPYLEKKFSGRIKKEAVKTKLKREHRDPKSLLMRSPHHRESEGVYLKARSIQEKKDAYPNLYK